MLNFSLETARSAAERSTDPAVTYVIKSLADEVELSHKREAELEEDLLDLQLRLSVLLAKLAPKDGESESEAKHPITGSVINISPGVVVDGKYMDRLRDTGSLADAITKYLNQSK